MKKLLKLLGVGLLSLTLLAGCGNSAGGSTAGTSETKSTETAKTEDVTLYITRHGKTMLNTVDRSQGWIDSPLTPAGIEVAEALGKGLDGLKFDAAYSSDSGRAIETATLVLENNGQKELADSLVTNKNIRELNFGTFEGMMNEEMWAAMAEGQGKTLDEFMERMQNEGMKDVLVDSANSLAKLDKEKVEEGVNWPAEDYDTYIARTTKGIDEIVKDAQSKNAKNVLVVSHGMTIAAFLSHIDPDVEMGISGLENASVSKVTFSDGKYSIESVNDMSYVEKGQE